ncbi:subtilisin-like protease [Mycena latifolia]|nr:subtilisin-like protease [Mycena latifolia]
MKAVLSLALLGATSVWAHDLSSVQRVTNLPGVSNKFIVEVAEASDIPSKRSLGTPHENLYRSLRERKIGFSVHKEYDAPGLFVGAAVTLTDAQDVASILSTEGVVAIRPIRTYSRPVPVSSKPVSPGDAGLPDGESTHVTTGVSRLHAMGITGKGVKIGILDTGIDYTHPSSALASVLASRSRGIIGCNPGNPFNISGVAPEATIYAYRIFGCDGSVQMMVIIVDALLMGVKAGMDILTMSLGGPDGWTEGTGSVVSSRIAATGKIVTIAAGNEGASGSWFTSGPGNGVDAISVASSDNTVVPLQSLTVEGATHDPIIYYATFPLPVNGTIPLYATSNDTTVVDDACNPLPDSTPDLSKFVVLIRRGTCTFVTKLDNVAKFGAKTFLIYDNGNGFAGITVGNYSAVLIQAEDGVFLGEQLATGVPISVTFPQSGASVQFPSPTGGLVSDFTSYGPTNDFYFKPALTAPGGNILSTLPVPLGSWALESGTSMATPFMAGSAALLFAVKGKSASVGKTARTLFQSTAQPISTSHTDGDPFQTATQQGAGLVQVFDALFATTILSPTELILNDTAHFAGPRKFTVKNTGKTVKTYTLSHVPAGTVLTVDPDTTFPVAGPVPVSADYATVTFNKGKFTLFPGQSQTVVATIKPPAGVDATTFPVYSGFIYAISGTESVHATYLGPRRFVERQVGTRQHRHYLWCPLPVVLDSAGNPQDAPVNYTFVGDDAPSLLWRQAFGTPTFRVDLGGSFAKVPILGSLLEIDYLGRNDQGENDDLNNTLVLSNTFANGTTISNGAYKVLIRALRVTGDATNEADYESWLSPVIGVAA